MRQCSDIIDSVAAGARLLAEDALTLWREAPLWQLGELAVARKREISGDKVFYNKNFHLEPTNLCVFNCKFCSFRRTPGSPEAWDMSMEEVEQWRDGGAYSRWSTSTSRYLLLLRYDSSREGYIAIGSGQGLYGYRVVVYDSQCRPYHRAAPTSVD